ncbi:hypothetical protein [Microbacterium sp. SD291]|uniref:hypothetical protein n=1 Tax=Microbacterium sp. SD291 TaxID=2782007 RepID=UPI001A972FBC|nr:hypothetical protein [Microbacterium sp. SD291]MBO0980275.1 hypothetical protein [Microbacterium sp. SD291]
MRVNKWGVGVIIAASILLTGCSAPADKPAEDKPAGATEETTAPASDCPELAEGATVDGAALGGCIADATTGTAGYSAKTTVMGMESTSRFSPADDAIESISPAGSIIVIGDDIWVKSATSEWQVADPASSDPMIAGLSTGAATVADTDLAATAGALSGEFTVTGKGTRLGQEVFLVTGTTTQQGVAVDVVFEVTADYVTLASTSSTEASGQQIEITMEVTEWDVPQEIVAPL